ncbi:MAG: CapA family protein [Muribaculaceae bacterium]
MKHIIAIVLLTLFGATANSQTINLTFVGDAMQHGPQIKAALTTDGSYNYSDCFIHLANDIADADFALVNLECPLGGKPYSGYPNFSAPDEFAKALHDVGFDFFATANNHCLDRRDAGLKRTIRQLDALNIPHVGTYLNAAARDTLCPQIVDVKGVRMAIMNYTYDTNGIPVQGKVVVDYINRDIIAADIAKAQQMQADLICVCMHWGIEYKLLPDEVQQSLADFIIDQGADLIIGSHPHVVEPMEIRHSEKWNKDVLLVYSLGNFISNQNGTDSRGGALVKVNLSRDMFGKMQLNNACYRLFFCQKPKTRKENYQLIPYGSENLLRADSKTAYDAFMRNAHNILNKHNVNVPEIATDSLQFINPIFSIK